MTAHVEDRPPSQTVTLPNSAKPGDLLVSTITLTRDRTLLALTATALAAVARWVAGPARTWAIAAALRARDFALQAGGLAALALAAYQLHPTAGIAAAGVALLVLQALLRPKGVTVPMERLLVMFAAARTGLTDDQILNPTDEEEHDGPDE